MCAELLNSVFFLLVEGLFSLSFKTTVYDNSRDKDEVICGDIILKKSKVVTLQR